MMRTDRWRLMYHLDNWSAWHKHYKPRLGYAAMRIYSSGVSGFDELNDQLNLTSARIMDKLINDLPTPLRVAIEVEYELMADVITSNRMSQAMALDMAHAGLIVGMDREGLM